MSKHHTLVNAINGVFSVYKPKGWTSRKATDVVQFALCNELCQDPQVKLKRRDRLKIGHGGTLDPLAEGVLVLGVGKGCKELQKYLKGPKEYLVSAKFGTSTTTYDSEGQEIKKATTKHMTKELILKTLPHFTGTITQVPPIYSALKIQGKRLYDYARNDLPLPEPIQPRQVTIKELELIEFKKEEDECILRVICGGGTYMRSLVNDLAIAMGTYGHMTALKRTKQGLFSTEDTLSLLDSSLTVKIVLDKIASGESRL